MVKVPRLGFPYSNSNSQSWGTITGGTGFTFAKLVRSNTKLDNN